MQVNALMAVDVIVIPLSATVTEAEEILRRAHVSGAPVVDRAGSPVGVFSVRDVAFGWDKRRPSANGSSIGPRPASFCRYRRMSRRLSVSVRWET